MEPSAALGSAALAPPRPATRVAAIPVAWQLTAVVFAATSVIVGLIWDISWHMTIGRDTFWTPAHLAIYTGGAVAGLVCGATILLRSYARRQAGAAPTDAAAGVTVWRVFEGPLGGWLCVWGAVAMLTSAPFDDWWHNAYGLDVQILSPPHSLLALGFIAILVGAQLMAVSAQSRAVDAGRDGGRDAWVVAYTCGLVLTIVAILAWEYQDRSMMRAPLFYQVAAVVYPLVLAAGARATRLRYPATAVAAVYTGVMLLQGWILPLFEAQPLLGPIRRTITHMVPLDFPLLLVPAAFALDVVLARLRDRGAWRQALAGAAAFLAVFTIAQYAFVGFLVSNGAHHALFFGDNLGYYVPADWRPTVRAVPLTAFASGWGIALVLAVVATRLGLGWGNWLRTVRR